jgi:hypothetical protein
LNVDPSFFIEILIFKITQQLVANEVTSTAPTADLEQPTEVPLNSSTFMFLSPLCLYHKLLTNQGHNMKIFSKERQKIMGTLGFLLRCYCGGSFLVLI